jgi:hypothetical protein
VGRNRILRGPAGTPQDELLDDQNRFQAYVAQTSVHREANGITCAASDFKSSEIIRNPVGMEIRLYKPPNATEERLREDQNEAVKLGLDMERGEARLVT